MTASKWVPGTFLVSYGHPVPKRGYLYAGLGIFEAWKASPKGRRPPVWSLTHLGSGHGVCRISAPEAQALEIAAEVAEASDWTFDGLYGWRNLDPEMPGKVHAVLNRYPREVQSGTGMGGSEEAARLIAEARA